MRDLEGAITGENTACSGIHFFIHVYDSKVASRQANGTFLLSVISSL